MNPYLSAVYGRAPVWGQNLLLSGFGYFLERERYGGRFAEFRGRLARSEHQSRLELESHQDGCLRDLVAHAYSTVPYYRRQFDAIGLKPSDVGGQADLDKIPLLTRADIKANFDDLWSTSVRPRRRRTGHTSGTTGTPLTLGYDLDTVWMTYAVFDRHYRWAHARFGRDGDRIAVARGNVIVPLDQRVAPFWRHNRMQRQLLLSSFHLSPSTLPEYFEALRAFAPAVMDGYPSTLYVLAKYLQGRGEFFPVKAAVTSSETLYDFQREVIEERFACKVFDYYALAERVIFSGECDAHDGHHVAMEYGLAEVVDERGQLVSDGTVGRLVGTSLINRAMPLLRYVTSDLSAMRPGVCRCGRALVRMEDVTTKAEDMLTLKDGRLISPSVLTHPFKPLDSIEGSQIVQTAPDAVTVRIVAGPAFSDHLRDHLVHELAARIGADVRIDVQLVDRLEVSPNGKFKWVISKVPLGI